MTPNAALVTPPDRRHAIRPVAPRIGRRRSIAVLATMVSMSVTVLVTLAPSRAGAIDTGRSEDSVESYLGINSTGIARLTRKLDESIGACMRKEGYEYYPESADVTADLIASASLNREDFVKKYGYGISTLVAVPKPGAKSRNQAYLDKLSKADRRVYNITLIGIDPDKPSADPQSVGTDDKSCVGKAQRSLFGDLAQILALESKYEDLVKRVNANTEVVRAMRDWSACMKKAGFSYSKEEAIIADLAKRLAAVGVRGALDGGNPLGTETERSIDRPGLSKLQKYELAIAKVDWACSKKHLGVREKIARDVNKTFIADNKLALDKVRTVFGGK